MLLYIQQQLFRPDDFVNSALELKVTGTMFDSELGY